MPTQRLSARGAAQESPMRKRAAIYDFGLILLLIFGGCCSNALALELTTRQLPASGTLLTLAQFVATTLIALLCELEWRSMYGWPVLWLRRPGVPLRRWLIQVVLYFITSILNNEAFAFHIPMSVHIVFRSGGMLVNMVLGYTVSGKRYSLLQLASVMLVTVGVIVATLSAAMPSASGPPSRHPMGDYMTGVALLSLALITSGCMGLFQEQTYAKYGREHWHEALFYSHLFSLPLFVLQSGALRQQIAHANQTPREWIGMCKSCQVLGFFIPSYYIKLALNVLTQLLCINGVNRLTSRVSSLSVSLILVVRKAVSLLISVVLLNHQTGSMGLWSGAAAVLVGTLGYSYGGLRHSTPSPKIKST
ncbi:golgi uridine diphosphate-N- acetylglucosamine transporter [Malassezia equina]|uniref:Golgi uridine diphosphate-N- acetylglucosamine transporter n=1 Tax=Malassezia equina TaxID=1381935 RepID=A0AAF0EDL4_9BASI|nr:golgi uridine diphosphate-N- acetylglucosamine transporter [Malassezia equina]